MRDLIVVDPGHRSASRHREHFGREAEVCDGNLIFIRFDGNWSFSFDFPTTDAGNRSQRNKQEDRQRACIQVSQKRNEYGHALGS